MRFEINIMFYFLTLIYYDSIILRKLHRRFDNRQYYIAYEDLFLTAHQSHPMKILIWPDFTCTILKILCMPFFRSFHNLLGFRLTLYLGLCKKIQNRRTKPNSIKKTVPNPNQNWLNILMILNFGIQRIKTVSDPNQNIMRI